MRSDLLIVELSCMVFGMLLMPDTCRLETCCLLMAMLRAV